MSVRTTITARARDQETFCNRDRSKPTDIKDQV